MKILAKVCLLLLLLLSVSGASAQSSEKLDLFFKLSDYYLKKYVQDGRVDYRYANMYSKEIDALYKLMGEVRLDESSEAEKKAFCINAYNLLVIYQVTKSYPINGPMDEDGFFEKKTHLVAGKDVSLNQLEKDMILETFQDPRFHFVLACAANSCPKLANFAYKPDNVEALLEARTKMTLNSDSFIKIDAASKRVSVSKIFEWYQNDFDKTGLSILEYINSYRSVKIPSDYKIEYYEYDWRLNERKS